MINFLKKIFISSNNLDNISQGIKEISKNTPINKIFKALNNYSANSEVRYVGGCIRKILNNEKVDDIDLATNLEPEIVCDVLNSNNINFYRTGIEHGTITSVIDDYKFEITSLREDVSTDGRHANVKSSITDVIVPCSIPVLRKFILLLFNTSQTISGSRFVARSMSSTFSLFNIFLMHPPTYLTSLFAE
jgi:hypothetical protein